MKALILFLILILTFQVSAQVKVKGYYRKDGTYVKPHYRSNPDGNPRNNWSYPGNTNPYTGETATGNSSTYLENYDNGSSSFYRYSTAKSFTLSPQKFNFKLIKELTKIKKHSVDDYLIQGYGFKKIEKRSNDSKRVYFRMHENVRNNFIGITVIFSTEEYNILRVVIGKNYSVSDLKIELLNMGYEYLHRDEKNLSRALIEDDKNLINSFLAYKKDDMLYSIGKEPNQLGASEILIFRN